MEELEERHGEEEGERDRDGEEEKDEEEEAEEEEKKDEEEEDIEPRWKVRCPLSHPAHPHNLSTRIGEAIQSGCYTCARQEYRTTFYYHCTTCDVDFHNGCYLRPKKIIHPYHLQHPLTITRLNTASEINNNIQTQSPLIFDRCSWCGSKPETWVYSCSICGFCLDLHCSQKNPLLTIANPKSHHHSLCLLPRPLLAPCDACGLVSALEASYACLQCNYVVHENCINLPRVIKLTRHPHRLFFTLFLPPAIMLCRVCYRAVDTRFGNYSCNHDEEDCSYVIHSICATHGAVWDGRELEWEPEEAEEIEDVASFTKVGDDLIDYFCHDHYLKLEKYDDVRDANKQCEACILPIDFCCFYNCLQCDYALHEVCAGLPRKLDHELHKHRLFLDPTPQDDYDDMTCSACFRKSTGFRYKCVEQDCVRRGCHIDLRCILIPHYFSHKSHEHPVFNSISFGNYGTECWICKQRCGTVRLHCTCTECDFAMCYRCATIPTELHYKHDEHPLSLCYGETDQDVGIYWCEVCEQEIDSGKWFYTCNKCCTTVHRECIFGSSIYMKSGSTFYHNGYEVKVISNNCITRLICAVCQDRCPYSVCYNLPHEYGWREKAICSFRCLQGAMFRICPEDM